MGATMCNHLSNFRHPALDNVDKRNSKGKGNLTSKGSLVKRITIGKPVPRDQNVASQQWAKMQTDLNDAKEKLETAKKDRNKFKTEAQKLKEDVEEKEARIKELNQTVDSHYNTIQKNKEELTNLDREVSRLNMENSSRQRELACVNESLATATQSSDSHVMGHRMANLAEATQDYTKTIIWRGTKFDNPTNPAVITKATRECWQFLVTERPKVVEHITESQYIVTYAGVVKGTLAKRRTDTSNAGKKASYGKHMRQFLCSTCVSFCVSVILK